MAFKFSYQTGLIDVGSYRGAPIQVCATFFIPAIVMSFPFWSRVSLTGLLLTLLFTVVLFLSLLAHELAHAAVGRRYRVPTERIEIDFRGGLVFFRGSPRTLGQDFAITAAGPLANLAIGVAALGVLLALPASAPQFAVEGSAAAAFSLGSILERTLRAAVYVNLGLCVVNLLPGFPLDGGRLVYLTVERRWNARIATLTVGALGLFFATLSSLVTLVTLIAGFPVWAPPAFAPNVSAVEAALGGNGGWKAVAYATDR